ncbi:MAG: hypothetical protein IJ802_00945 [Kiritimatiellae bacterium]|nr:hypothetical protein [Kiritimatiellia bacterium]
MVLIAVLAFMVMMGADAFFSISRKNRLQNAGDAAALAAARAQGRLINEVGRLNLARADAFLRGDVRAADEFLAEARRLVLAGPVENAFTAAQDAARENHAFNNPEAVDFLYERNNWLMREVLATLPAEHRGDLQEYAGTLAYILAGEAGAGGIAAAPDNMKLFDFEPQNHLLYSQAFYEAVMGRNWCWFHFNAMDVLAGYKSYHDWSPLPVAAPLKDFENSEIFPLLLVRKSANALDMCGAENLLEQMQRHGFAKWADSQDLVTNQLLNAVQTWYCYDDAEWGGWEEECELQEFMTGAVLPEYDVAGADAVARVEADGSVWSAAAKPFGTIETKDGGRMKATALGWFVVPAFTSARLIPLDAAHGGDARQTSFDWMHHAFFHLPRYMESGPAMLPAECRWCNALKTWERDSFRRAGVLWLKVHSNECRRPRGGGTHYSGGRRHGH